jgi:hypothetical protein
MTVAERRAELLAAPGVVAVTELVSPVIPQAYFGGAYRFRLSYAVESGDDVTTTNSADLFILGWTPEEEREPETPPEVATWLGQLPRPLVDNTVVYISDRTVGNPITATQIEAFANAQWKAQAGHSAAANIRRFQVAPVDGKTVMVTGLFNVIPQSGAATWETRSYLIRMIDANGNPSGSNIVFERLV